MDDARLSQLVDLSDDKNLFEVNKKGKERGIALVKAGKAMLDKDLLEKGLALGLSREEIEAALSNDDMTLGKESLGLDEK